MNAAVKFDTDLAEPEKTLDGFVAFVKAQDPEKQISHLYWTTCAVGEYLGAGGEGAHVFASTTLASMYSIIGERNTAPTYGEMAKQLTQYGY